MSKCLDLIKRQQLEIIDGYPTGNIYIGVTKEELTELENELTNYCEGIKNAETYVPRSGKDALFNLECLAIKNVHKHYWKLPKQLADDVRKELKEKEELQKLLDHERELNNHLILHECKALEIIKKKNVKIEWLKYSNSVEKYNQGIGDTSEYLTPEEYDLLKEVLKYGK